MENMNSTAACVLGLLELGPAPGMALGLEVEGMTGWQIYETAERSLTRFWNVTRSQIYTELSRLAEEGLVETVGEQGPRSRRPYRITEAGRRAFREWLAGWAAEEPRDDQLHSPLLLTIFFGDYLPAGTVLRVLQEYRPRYQRQNEQLREMLNAVGEEGQARLPTAVLRRGLAYRQMMVRWIDEVLALLQTSYDDQDIGPGIDESNTDSNTPVVS
jgi:DNA-binding PadR family transcriptional regulator